MKTLQDATEKICELKGSVIALDALLVAMIEVLTPELRARLLEQFEAHTEIARTAMLHAPISEHTIGSFEEDVRRTSAIVSARCPARAEPQGEFGDAQLR